MNQLERRYRRLLSWYPAEYRLACEEEMVGVLLATASPQQQRPGWRDALDLLWNATKTRLSRESQRATLQNGPKRWWRDASAIFGFIGAIVLLTDQLRAILPAQIWEQKLAGVRYLVEMSAERWVLAAGWLVVVACLALKKRTAAAAAALGTAVFEAVWFIREGVPGAGWDIPWWWQIGLTASVAITLTYARQAAEAKIGGRWMFAIGATALLGVAAAVVDALVVQVTIYDDSALMMTPGLPLETRAGVGLDYPQTLLAIVIFLGIWKLASPIRRRVLVLAAPTVLLILMGWLGWGDVGVFRRDGVPATIVPILAAIAVFLAGVLVVRRRGESCPHVDARQSGEASEPVRKLPE